MRRSAKRAERPATKSRAAAAAPARTASAKPKRKSPAKAKPAATAGAAAKAKPKAKAQARPQPRTAPRRKVPPAGYAAPASRADDAPGSSAADLISTTIQAAAELTQIGVTVGRQTLRSMLDKLPKP